MFTKKLTMAAMLLVLAATSTSVQAFPKQIKPKAQPLVQSTQYEGAAPQCRQRHTKYPVYTCACPYGSRTVLYHYARTYNYTGWVRSQYQHLATHQACE